MRFTNQIATVAAFLLIGTGAQASLLIEPFLGYETTKQTATIATIDAAAAVTGTNYGLRLGYKLPVMAWVALDGTMGTGKMKFDATGTFLDSDVSRSTLGLTAGIDLPVLLRVWVGTSFSDQMEVKASGAKDTFKGSHTKLGVGFTMLPLVSLNVEYLMRKYTSGSGDNIDANGGFGTYIQKAEQNTVMVSVSLPFNF